MLGSDYGAGAVERGMALITDGLRDAGLDDASRNAILRTNAQQIFRLDPDAN
jgi:predicted TIM-barrel fold metal-dependent hydrolase